MSGDISQRQLWREAVSNVCPGEGEWLDWVEGRVAGDRLEFMEQHRAVCMECQQRVEDALLFTGIADERALAVASADVEEVMQRISPLDWGHLRRAKVAPVPPVVRRSAWMYVPVAWGAAAAMLLVTTGGGYVAWQRDERQSGELARLQTEVRAKDALVAELRSSSASRVELAAYAAPILELHMDVARSAAGAGNGPAVPLPAAQGLTIFVHKIVDDSVTGVVEDAQGSIVVRDMRFQAQRGGMSGVIPPGKLPPGVYRLRLSNGGTSGFRVR